MTGPEKVDTVSRTDRLGAILTRTGLYILAVAIICLAIQGDNLAVRLFRTQDLAILATGGLMLLALGRRPFAMALPRLRIPPVLLVGAIAALVLVTCWAGTWLVFGGYALTRDELLADFDATFLARGMLFAPVPVEWRSYSGALMPQYMLPIPADIGWLSGYLPANAALRAIGRVTIGSDWASPILAAITVLALYGAGRRLWPQTPLLPLLPVILLVSSAQFLTMAMTPYAMTAHLAFNQLWLWCFLRADRRGEAGALAAGFVATGLHQLLFHPLFVFPFIVEMWFTGSRRRAIFYAAAYVLIGLFWATYWRIALPMPGTAGDGAGGPALLAGRALALLAALDWSAIPLMALNLSRFLSWQNLLLLPLALLAWPAIRRGEGPARPLAMGIVLTILVMLFLLPWQGHGWGYRYLHGFIGSFCILAGYGWKSLANTTDSRRRTGALAIGTATSLALILPVHLFQARGFVAPYRAASAALGRSPADVVLVDGTGLLYAEDLVRNAPDLSNRPKIMDLNVLTEPQLVALCRRYRVARLLSGEARAIGIPAGEAPPGSPVVSSRNQLLDRIGCGIPASAGAATRAAQGRTD
jgi:hypothetical protein